MKVGGQLGTEEAEQQQKQLLSLTVALTSLPYSLPLQQGRLPSAWLRDQALRHLGAIRRPVSSLSGRPSPARLATLGCCVQGGPAGTISVGTPSEGCENGTVEVDDCEEVLPPSLLGFALMIFWGGGGGGSFCGHSVGSIFIWI